MTENKYQVVWNDGGPFGAGEGEWDILRPDGTKLAFIQAHRVSEATAICNELNSLYDKINSKIVRADAIIANYGFPKELGQKLAQQLVSVNWNKTIIDISRISSAVLISAFFHGFYDLLKEELTNDDYQAALNVKWITQFEWQQDSIQAWIKYWIVT